LGLVKRDREADDLGNNQKGAGVRGRLFTSKLRTGKMPDDYMGLGSRVRPGSKEGRWRNENMIARTKETPLRRVLWGPRAEASSTDYDEKAGERKRHALRCLMKRLEGQPPNTDLWQLSITRRKKNSTTISCVSDKRYEGEC